MDTLPLPARPDLDHYRKRAKELVAAARSDDPAAIDAWRASWLDRLVRLRGGDASTFVRSSYERAFDRIAQQIGEESARSGGRQSLTLATAQHLIARAHGFPNWAGLAAHIESAAAGDEDHAFEAAADAVVDGNVEALEALLQRYPRLATARSPRTHRATLLHYVAANGVEDFRQRTPPSALRIARVLLEAGAAVDASADTYDGNGWQTTMNLLVSSVHPSDAGLQPALVETLLDFGAAIDGPDGDGSPIMTAIAFGYPESAEVLARRGAKIDNVISAAAVGRIDLLTQLLDERQAPDFTRRSLGWLGEMDVARQSEVGLVWASAYGREQAVNLLLDRRVNPTARDIYGITALHWAINNGHLAIAKRLLARGADVNAVNAARQTVIASAVREALRYPQHWEYFARAIGMLLEAGADRQSVPRPTGDGRIDALLST
jgi:ankyrin repeat protein